MASNCTSRPRMMSNRSNLMCKIFVMWLRDPSLSCTHSACYKRQWCNEVGVIAPVGPLFPPASSDEYELGVIVIPKILVRPHTSQKNPIKASKSSSVEFRELTVPTSKLLSVAYGCPTLHHLLKILVTQEGGKQVPHNLSVEEDSARIPLSGEF
ncbi:hypothetical protein TNCV_234071 [Trichonephila clavipes]|uniref:Uncharacterized protein n=1 Tax=Trichonephila clavipes TaxID=2585209 RepID=A0A8X6VDX6_TRICX|nr:hypothetical protein TNCV_234071 [Trichonephila clavipes]